MLMNDLEAFKYFQQSLMGVELIPDLGPLRILALGSGSSFKRMDLPKTWAGVFVITEDRFYSIANVDKYSNDLKKPSIGRQVLLHEYTHFLSRFSVNRRSFPLWYEEGKTEAESLVFAFNQNFEQFEQSVEEYVLSGLMMRVISLNDGTISFPAPEIKLETLTAERFKAQIGYFISE